MEFCLEINGVVDFGKEQSKKEGDSATTSCLVLSTTGCGSDYGYVAQSFEVAKDVREG